MSTNNRYGWDDFKGDQNARNRRMSAAGRDIADGWDDERPNADELELRDRCREDLRLYLASYFPETFHRPFNADQLEIVSLAQSAILDGDMAAACIFRGGGKTSILLRSVLWAASYGHRLYPVLLAAKAEFGERLLTVLKRELATNPQLRRPFRALTYPILKLEGDGRRAGGQTFRGERTQIGWGAERLIFPTMPDDCFDGLPNVSGHIIECGGITAALRGKMHLLPGGRTIRPDFLALDDVQDRESAQSVTQVEDRLRIINGDALALGGVGSPMAAIAALTVIAENDVADQLTNRDLNPAWRGIRRKFVRQWPEREDLWEQYIGLRREGMRTGAGIAAAVEFYREHRAEMDEGAIVADENCRGKCETAIEWAYVERDRIGHAAFASEYQNEPLRPDDTFKMLTAQEIAAKLNAHARGTVPAWVNHLVAFCDVHDDLLFYAVCGFRRDFTGAVVDYGVWPKQNTVFTNKRKAGVTLKSVASNAGREGAVRAGILALTNDLLGRPWMREDGVALRIERMLVDAGFLPTVVSDACRASPHAAVLLPSRGLFIGPDRRKISEYPLREDEQLGTEWLLKPMAKGRQTRVCHFDSNWWKSFTHSRWNVAIGDTGALALFGRDAREHSVFAEHQVGEIVTRVEAKGVKSDQWVRRPGAEVHWFDCIVGCQVAASMLGCTLADMRPETTPEPETLDPRTFRKRSMADWLKSA